MLIWAHNINLDSWTMLFEHLFKFVAMQSAGVCVVMTSSLTDKSSSSPSSPIPLPTGCPSYLDVSTLNVNPPSLILNLTSPTYSLTHMPNQQQIPYYLLVAWVQGYILTLTHLSFILRPCYIHLETRLPQSLSNILLRLLVTTSLTSQTQLWGPVSPLLYRLWVEGKGGKGGWTMQEVRTQVYVTPKTLNSKMQVSASSLNVKFCLVNTRLFSLPGPAQFSVVCRTVYI